MKQRPAESLTYLPHPAAFGRLCVETKTVLRSAVKRYFQPPSGGCVLKRLSKLWLSPNFIQPPSGGCVLKLYLIPILYLLLCQPPSGGCVLKQRLRVRADDAQYQPPSGGCVLKQTRGFWAKSLALPAAFGRLCVETWFAYLVWAETHQPPSGGCVLKHAREQAHDGQAYQPPSGGCVLKLRGLL